MTTWKQIRVAAEAAGLDVADWERGMHDRILESVLTRTKSAEKYYTSVEFHTQMEQLVAYVLAAIFEHDPLSEDMRHRAEDLGSAFRDEIKEARSSGRSPL